MEFYEREVNINHPMEDVLGIEPGSTTVTEFAMIPQELVEHGDYDAKDNEIEGQIQEVYELAVQAFHQQMGTFATTEDRNRPRNMEVANAFLQTALQAVSAKTTLKTNKDRNLTRAKSSSQPTSVTNNTLVMDRNSLMKMLRDVPPEDNAGATYDHDGTDDNKGSD